MLQHNKEALIIVDVQNDFCEGGNLEVQDGDEVVPVINQISNKFDKVIATQDWHDPEHVSFASSHEGKEPFDKMEINGYKQNLWPDHCVKGTEGADLHPELDKAPVDLILRKGSTKTLDSYSAFRENDKETHTGLAGYLDFLDIQHVFITGLATDVCVLFTALDSIELGFDTYLIKDGVRGVDQPEGSVEKAFRRMEDEGVKLLDSSDFS